MSEEVDVTPAAPVAAPVTAPAVPQAPNLDTVTADPKTPATPAAVPVTADAYESTGNANADYALGQIAAAGIGPTHPAAVAAMEGNFALLKHALAAAGVPGADHLVSMLTESAVEEAEKDEAYNAQVAADVYAMAGSQEQWDTVLQWGREHADEGEKEALNAMFADPKSYKIAAGYLLGQYDRAGGPREAIAPVVNPDGAGARAGSRPVATPLNRVQFAEEAAKLRAVHGDAYTQTAEYQALGRRLQR